MLTPVGPTVLTPVRGLPAGGRCSLADLCAGQQAVICDVADEVEPATSRRMVDLGFAPGSQVQVLRRTPLADPVMFRIAGYESHGGAIIVARVQDDEVEVELSGSCSHCPAAELTLAGRFEAAVRELYPALRAVRGRDAPSSGSRGPLGLLPIRPR